VDAEKQPLFGNGTYTRSRGTRHVTVEEVLQAAPSLGLRRASCYATLRKNYSCSNDQHATIEEAVFSVGVAPSLYIEELTQLELELSGVQ
jgi:hypothetical protein